MSEECRHTIGELGWNHESVLTTFPELIKHAQTTIHDVKYAVSHGDELSIGDKRVRDTNGMCFISDNLDRFSFCPRCGEKLDWVDMIDKFRRCVS